MSWRRSAAPSTAAPRSIGSVRWSRNPSRRTSPPRASALRSWRRGFPGRVGLVHGGMKAEEKDRAMAAFAAGGVDLLVATTVIEVGVDVPAATVMVVERAERFGLAQLHQLRGRIGRGEQPSTCLLLYQSPLSEAAKRRLQIMRETEDGFRIAEEDLRLRGAGEVLGHQTERAAELAARRSCDPRRADPDRA